MADQFLMGLLGTSQILWSGHTHPVQASGTQVVARIASHAQKRVVGVYDLLPFDDRDPDDAGVHQTAGSFLTLS